MIKNKTNNADKILHRVKMHLIDDDGQLFITPHSSKIPFQIKRVYCIVDAATHLPRGYHAHKSCYQALFCLKGGLRITLDDGKRKMRVMLDQKKPGRGVLQNKMIWIEMDKFQPNTILLVLASEDYNPGDYIRSYPQFLKEVAKLKQ
jgi:hypothetical protein